MPRPDLVLRHDGAGFLIEVGGASIGHGFVRAVTTERLLDAFPYGRLAHVDVRLADTAPGEGVASAAVGALTELAFDDGYHLAFGVDVADDDRAAFLGAGYVAWRRVKRQDALRYDLICRPDHFYGRAAVMDHPGADKIMAGDSPGGATIVVYRREPALQVLLLHRAHEGPDYEGEWAWTPPAGARFPAEPIEHCAARELHEEIGVEAAPQFVGETNDGGWAIYMLEVPADAEIELDEEHDRYEWLSPMEAQRRCLPAVVGDAIPLALGSLT